jgi:hypothetical protein
MSPALLIAVSWFVQGQAADATFQDALLGLSFSFPKTWKVENRKHDSRLTMRLPGGGEARVEIFRFGYVGSAEDWFATQRNVNISLRAETLRQWQEEILSVPMLLSKSRLSASADPKVVLQGLLYSRTNQKLLFRLTSSAGAYDEAEFAWRQVLQTIKTLDGSIPKAEDPDRVPEEPPKGSKPGISKPGITKPPPVTELGKPKASDFKKASVAIPLKVANRDFLLRIPADWVAEVKGPDRVVLRNKALAGDVSVSIASLLDSDSPGRALAKASIATLKEFDKVVSREETLPKANTAGAMMAYVWRVGSSTSGPHCTLEATGLTDEQYWLARWSGVAKEGAPMLKVLLGLCGQMSLERAP